MLYYAYGSNLCLPQFHARCRGSRLLGPAWLQGYMLRFAGHGHADIVQAPGQSVAGALFEITEDGARALDRYEGVSSGYYRRVQVTVEDSDGETSEAMTYRMVRGHGPAEPSLAYLAVIVVGCRQCGIDPDPIVKRAVLAGIEVEAV